MNKIKIYKEDNLNKNLIILGDPSGSPDDFISIIVFIDNAYLLRLKNYLFASVLRFNMKGKNDYVQVSKIIRACVERRLIKQDESKRYVPAWA